MVSPCYEQGLTMQDVQFDELVPDPQVRRELGGIAEMTVWRWDNGKSKAPKRWTPPIRIGQRKFRTRGMIEAVKTELIRCAIESSNQEVASVPVKRHGPRGP